MGEPSALKERRRECTSKRRIKPEGTAGCSASRRGADAIKGRRQAHGPQQSCGRFPQKKTRKGVNNKETKEAGEDSVGEDSGETAECGSKQLRPKVR